MIKTEFKPGALKNLLSCRSSVEPGAKVWALPPPPCLECKFEAVHECFEDLGEVAQLEAARNHARQNPGRPEMSYVVITKDDVIEAIEKIPNAAAPGPDGVLPCLLKRAKNTVSKMLADFFVRMTTPCQLEACRIGYLQRVDRYRGAVQSVRPKMEPIS